MLRRQPVGTSKPTALELLREIYSAPTAKHAVSVKPQGWKKRKPKKKAKKSKKHHSSHFGGDDWGVAAYDAAHGSSHKNRSY